MSTLGDVMEKVKIAFMVGQNEKLGRRRTMVKDGRGCQIVFLSYV